MMQLNQYTKTALKAAQAGSKVLLSYFNKPIRVDYKGKIDPVTIADKSSQYAIIEVIKKSFPEHEILGEEDNKTSLCKEYCWIIDPLDGTVNFIHNLPIFCVSVGLSYKGEIISGVIHAPLLKETFIAEKNKGAWFNKFKINVSSINSLIKSLVITGFPYHLYSNPDKLSKNFANVLQNVQGVRRLGSAALDLAYVAMGRFDAFWEEGLHPWDVAAGSLLVTEAGGRVSDFNYLDNYIFGGTILATNGLVHKKMLKIIK